MASLKFRAQVEVLLQDSYQEAVKTLTRKVISKGEGLYDWSRINEPGIKELFIERFLDHFERKKVTLLKYIEKEKFKGNDMLVKYSELINAIDKILNDELSRSGNLMAGDLDPFKMRIMIKMEQIFR